jgi:hypothetical protein
MGLDFSKTLFFFMSLRIQNEKHAFHLLEGFSTIPKMQQRVLQFGKVKTWSQFVKPKLSTPILIKIFIKSNPIWGYTCAFFCPFTPFLNYL